MRQACSHSCVRERRKVVCGSEGRQIQPSKRRCIPITRAGTIAVVSEVAKEGLGPSHTGRIAVPPTVWIVCLVKTRSGRRRKVFTPRIHNERWRYGLIRMLARSDRENSHADERCERAKKESNPNEVRCLNIEHQRMVRTADCTWSVRQVQRSFQARTQSTDCTKRQRSGPDYEILGQLCHDNCTPLTASDVNPATTCL